MELGRRFYNAATSPKNSWGLNLLQQKKILLFITLDLNCLIMYYSTNNLHLFILNNYNRHGISHSVWSRTIWINTNNQIKKETKMRLYTWTEFVIEGFINKARDFIVLFYFGPIKIFCITSLYCFQIQEGGSSVVGRVTGRWSPFGLKVEGVRLRVPNRKCASDMLLWKGRKLDSYPISRYFLLSYVCVPALLINTDLYWLI